MLEGAVCLAEVGGEDAGDVAEVDLALRAVHLEQLALVQVVVVHDVWVVLQNEVVIALLADHLQRLASPHHVRLAARAPGSQHPPLRSAAGHGGYQKEHDGACQEAGLGAGGGRHGS